MDISVVLAMHGVLPKEFPKKEIMELFMLHHRLESASRPERQALEKRRDEIEGKMRNWPRTAENDPFFASSQTMAKKLGEVLGKEVFQSLYSNFNNFQSILSQARHRGEGYCGATDI
jgi:sirohydrochlorin cobaltochelatase